MSMAREKTVTATITAFRRNPILRREEAEDEGCEKVNKAVQEIELRREVRLIHVFI